MRSFLYSVKAKFRFRDYKPQCVTYASARRWFSQFDKSDKKLAGELLEKVIYISEKATLDSLVHQNRVLMAKLLKNGLPPKKLIYVSIHDAGSSSPVMLSMLRDAAGLEQSGCNLVDSRSAMELNKLTNKLEEGAIIYIDDFVGSGTQFAEAREFAIQSVVGNFSEFLIVPSICEEGFAKLAALGVDVFTDRIHYKAERPLHTSSRLLKPSAKSRLIEICKTISPKMSLGYDDMATMVVFYRNAPNSIPAVLRGSKSQRPFYGIFPRSKDMPVSKAS